MNESWKAAIKESFACATSDEPMLETLEFYNPLLGPEFHIFIVKDIIAHDFTLEDGVTIQHFQVLPFNLTLPRKAEDGGQEMTITVDNTDRRIGEFLKASRKVPAKTLVKFRPYLASIPTEPQMDPPMTMVLSESSITKKEATVRASFINFSNKKWPSTSEYYNRNRFPSIGQ